MSNSDEKWLIHAKAQELSSNFIQLYPILESLHNAFKTDIIHMDMSRIGQLFDSQGLIRERLNIENPFWTRKNPFPINPVSNDDEILSIWDRKIPGSDQLIFTQRKIDVEALIKLKNENPLNTILIVCTCYKTFQKENRNLTVEVCTCYMIRIIFPTDEKKSVQYLLTVEPTLIFK